MIFLTQIYSSKMDIQAYETLIITQLNEVVENIINNHTNLQIAVKKGERVGDGISKFLENKFVEFTKNHSYFKEKLFKLIPFGINSFIFNLITQNLFTIAML